MNQAINLKSIFRISLFILGIILIYNIQNLVLLLFLTYIIASGLNPFINFIQNKVKLSRGIIALAIVVLFFGGIGSVIYFSIRDLITQSSELLTELPSLTNRLINRFGFDGFIEVTDNQDLYNRATKYFNFSNNNFSSTILSFSSSILSGLITLVTMATITFYQLLEPNKIKNFIVSLSSKSSKDKTGEIVEKVQFKLGRWVLGQFGVMFAMGILSYVGFALLGLEYALPLAVIVGVTDIIPVIGPVIAMVPIMIVAFATIPLPQAILVGVYIIILQQVEGNFLVPKIMNQSVGLDPIVVIIAILIGSQILGILGALLAIPVSVIGLILFDEWQKSRD